MNFRRPEIGKKVFVEIESSVDVDHFTYQIISLGKVYYSDTVQVPDRKRYVLEFVPTFELAPKARVLAYHCKHDRIISAYTDINIANRLRNYVKLKLSTQQATPGQNIDIDISSGAHSYVGLVGVDQSVLLLKQNDDLTVEQAYAEVEKYPKSSNSKRDNYHSDWSNFQVISRLIVQVSSNF